MKRALLTALCLMASYVAMAQEGIKQVSATIAPAALVHPSGQYLEVVSVDLERSIVTLQRFKDKATAQAPTAFDRAPLESVYCPSLAAELAKPADSKLSVAENITAAAIRAVRSDSKYSGTTQDTE